VAHLAWVNESQPDQSTFGRRHGDLKNSWTSGDVPRPHNPDVDLDTHASQQRREHLSQVMGYRREVLKDATLDARPNRAVGEARERQHAQGEHGCRPGRPDVPLEGTSRNPLAWREGELAAVDLNTVRNGPRELRARTYARNMLWPQSPLRTAVADVDQPDRVVLAALDDLRNWQRCNLMKSARRDATGGDAIEGGTWCAPPSVVIRATKSTMADFTAVSCQQVRASAMAPPA
jgi:hypothetical protein